MPPFPNHILPPPPNFETPVFLGRLWQKKNLPSLFSFFFHGGIRRFLIGRPEDGFFFKWGDYTLSVGRGFRQLETPGKPCRNMAGNKKARIRENFYRLMTTFAGGVCASDDGGHRHQVRPALHLHVLCSAVILNVTVKIIVSTPHSATKLHRESRLEWGKKSTAM